MYQNIQVGPTLIFQRNFKHFNCIIFIKYLKRKRNQPKSNTHICADTRPYLCRYRTRYRSYTNSCLGGWSRTDHTAGRSHTRRCRNSPCHWAPVCSPGGSGKQDLPYIMKIAVISDKLNSSNSKASRLKKKHAPQLQCILKL